MFFCDKGKNNIFFVHAKGLSHVKSPCTSLNKGLPIECHLNYLAFEHNYQLHFNAALKKHEF